jgi:hypothetical protein
MADLPSGPTLNPEYNALLVAWAEQGHPCDPECEECGDDLTGKEVHETGIAWVCSKCKPIDPVPDEYPLDYDGPTPRRDPNREDFHADG